MNDARLLRHVRLGALVVGAVLLLIAMLVVPEKPRPRDLAWTLGVACLILSLVANWLLRRAPDGDADVDPTGGRR